jgi:hypothetical protein
MTEKDLIQCVAFRNGVKNNEKGDYEEEDRRGFNLLICD